MPETIEAHSKPTEARTIPGLGSVTSGASGKASKRSRPKSAAKAPQTETTTDSASAAPAKEKPASLHLSPEALLVPQDNASVDIPPKVPASVTVSKRIKGLQKKLQRIQGYADSTAALNEDQKRAVQSKPALESTIKELQDVFKLLEQDEAEQAKHDAARSTQEEKRVQSRISLAVHESQKQAQSDLTLLLQFFHLSNLFNPDTGFNPPVLPAVVQNASGQEMAAVKTLAEAFINGPLLGGGDDAFERLVKLAKADTSDVVEGVSYGRVKQMVLDLSAAPGEVAPDTASVAGDERPHINGHSTVTDEDRSAAQEAQSHVQSAPGLNFMQASELDQPQSQPAPAAEATNNSPWNDAPANAASSTWGQSQAPSQQAVQALGGAAAPESWGADQAGAVSSWADDVEQARQPQVEAAQTPAEAPAPAADAAPAGAGAAEQQAPAEEKQQQQKGGNRGGRRNARGGPKGEGRGRGNRGPRGGARSDNNTPKDAADGDDWVKVSSGHEHRQQGQQRGRGRGGAPRNGGGRGNREGRSKTEGRPQQQQQQPTQA